MTWLSATTWQQRLTLALATVGAAGCAYLIVYLLGVEIHVFGLSLPARGSAPAVATIRSPGRTTPRAAEPRVPSAAAAPSAPTRRKRRARRVRAAAPVGVRPGG